MYLHHGKTPIPVLFENEFCIVLNKPSGLSVQGGEGVKVSLDSILSENISPRPLLVHRLDRDTSGIILVAKTKTAAAGFSTLLARTGVPLRVGKGVLKQYLGVCSGVPEHKQGVIKQKLDIRGSKKESETRYKLLSSAASQLDGMEINFSLLELELGTGRMHQIRRHLARTGNPVLGDDKYGDFSLNKKLRKAYGLNYLLLHASRLVIQPEPILVPEGLDISAAPPEYFSGFMRIIALGR